MTAAVVDHVIERCTAPGDLVLDPFAGFGTTLERAVRLGRRAAGVELLPERVDHVRRRVPGALVVEGDARELSALLGGVVPEAGV
ncbi:MAG: site-specific DNA-methyltransferase, partial [Propionibacterium sp.]|nr:site-specific DNA-methyltransferase [Propionibacterium sp.]